VEGEEKIRIFKAGKEIRLFIKSRHFSVSALARRKI